MTQKEILQYNKRCAEFLGAQCLSPNTKYSYFDFGESWENKNFLFQQIIHSNMLKFHSDWNWIMEIVEAIEKLGYNRRVDIDSSHVLIQYKEWYTLVQENSKKEAVVQAINQFLIWYNNQNK